MNRYSVALSLVLFNPFLAAAKPAAKPESTTEASALKETEPKPLEFAELVHWILKYGKDRVFYEGRDAKPMGLPMGGSPGKAWATGKTNPYHRISLIGDSAAKDAEFTSICLTFIWSKDYPKKLKDKTYDFRFGLSGKLERASSSIGENHPDGTPVRASSSFTKLDIEDPEIQEKAQAELDFWLKKAAKLTAKKKAVKSKKK